MKIMNCASLIALVAGGLAVSVPASAAPLSPTSLTASHDMLQAVSLPGDDALRGALSHQQQQQQQQQRRNLVAEAGVIYGAPLGGFNV